MTSALQTSDPEKFSWTQDVEDAIEESNNGPVPLNMEELLHTAEKVADEIKKAEVEEQATTPKPTFIEPSEEDDDLDALVKESESLSGFTPNPRMMTRALPPTKHSSVSQTENESFTSQRETAELRGDLEFLSSKVIMLEKTLETLLKERETIPGHIQKIQENMNSQLTLMMDKVINGIESVQNPVQVKTAQEEIELVRSDANEQLSAMRSLASAAPSSSSPLVKATANLAGKRRFKPVK
nr:hypothetical protein [Plasmopara viticola lesion associated mononegaambi virus 7]